jgi:hypothetical protein
MPARLGLTDHETRVGNPRSVVAELAAGAPSTKALVYLGVPFRSNHWKGAIEADPHALATWPGRESSGLPGFESTRVAFEHVGVPPTYSLTQLHATADPRVYVFAA